MMNTNKALLLVAILIGVGISTASAYPLTNVVLDDNADGWFTMDNVDDYGADLDDRLEEGEIVFTGHPSYVIASDDARLLNDRSRIHYFVSTFEGHRPGNESMQRIHHHLVTGKAKLVITGPMTRTILQQNATVRRAFAQHYCEVADARQLYERTDAKLFRWVESREDCLPALRVNESHYEP